MKKIEKYSNLIKEYISKSYKDNFREADEKTFVFPYISPGAKYSEQLWDWDSWLTGLALLEIDKTETIQYQKGCVLNFLIHIDDIGRIPILIEKNTPLPFKFPSNYHSNIHKPCIAQHALKISKITNDATWLKDYFSNLIKYISYYEKYQKDKESGLFFWHDDLAIGFDNDPTVFYRPNNSTGAIFLNSLMYSELIAIANLADMLNNKQIFIEYTQKANCLANAIRNECFDNIDGYFYSVDLSLKKIDPNSPIHKGQPRFWHSLPIKITTWAGLLPLWNKIATKEQADRCIKHILKKDSIFCENGIRSIAKFEKMYGIYQTGNPSCWIGPVWINASYFAYIALKNYGYNELANKLSTSIITMLGKDIEQNGQFHEYYDPETGKGVHNKGFQSWNLLILNILNDINK